MPRRGEARRQGEPRRKLGPLPNFHRFAFETTVKLVEKSEKKLIALKSDLKSEKQQFKRDKIRQLIFGELKNLSRLYTRAIEVANFSRDYDMPSIKFAHDLENADRTYAAKIEKVKTEIRKIHRKVREN